MHKDPDAQQRDTIVACDRVAAPAVLARRSR